jgi:hypothetical protein
MKENKDYELILGEDTSENWNVRILTGDFVETVIEYKAIAFNEIKDHLSFNYNIVSSPSILTEDNEGLQYVAGKILEDIIERGLEDGSIGMMDRSTGEDINIRSSG